MMNVIPYAQGFAAGAWLLVVAYFAKDIALVLQRRATPMSVFCTLWAAMGLVQVGFTARWYAFPHTVPLMQPDEIAVWIFLYLMSGGVACHLLVYAALHYRRRAR